VIRELANGSKHFRPNQAFDTMRVRAAPFMFDQIHAGFDQGVFGGPIPYVEDGSEASAGGKGYLLIDYGEDAGDHRWLTATCLLEVVLRFWRDFFAKYHPPPNLPVSSHHVD
jgi:hypothetical protein